jgi:hypothetical protein
MTASPRSFSARYDRVVKAWRRAAVQRDEARARVAELEAGEAETRTEYRIWRRQPDGTETGMGSGFDARACEPYLARPDRWIVRSRAVRTWRGAWEDVVEPADVVDYLADCRDNSEVPEHDGAPT